MTFTRLVVRSLLFHGRGNLAVLLGVAVGAAVLTGALLVGDSLAGSLRERAERQFGWVDQALLASRFFREELADGLARDEPRARLCPALLLQGTVTASDRNGNATPAPAPHPGRATVLGVGERFWPDGDDPIDPAFWRSAVGGVVLNAALARDLGVSRGDTVTVRWARSSAVPRETPLGAKDASETLATVKVPVRAILAEGSWGDVFSLNSTTAVPRNAFLPLRFLQHELAGAGSGRRGPRERTVDRPINAVLAGGGDAPSADQVARRLTLDDWGLLLRDPDRRARDFFAGLDANRDRRVTRNEWPRLRDRGLATELDRNGNGSVDVEEMAAFYRTRHDYLSLESRQLFIEPTTADAAGRAAAECGLAAAPTLVYLAHGIENSAQPRQAMSYAVVAALDPASDPPLGPFLPAGASRLTDDEIVLVDWPGSLLGPASGAKEVTLKYLAPEEQEQDPWRDAVFRVRGWIPPAGPADDPSLTPEFPGITEKVSLDQWDPPPSMHYDPTRVRKPADEDYWKSFRTTPKAYITLAAGRRLWGNRFGNATSVRLAPPSRAALTSDTARQFTQRLLNRLRPEEGGFVFHPVRQRALEASARGSEFGFLFLAFSVFLIAASLLLVGLLFRLNLDRRAAEVGVLLAAGFRRGRVRRLLLAEGALVTVAGSLLGLAASVLYAGLLLDYLRTAWPGGLEGSFLRLHVTAASLTAGFVAAVLVSVLAVAWAVRGLARVSPRALLAGETAEPNAGERGRPAIRVWVAVGLAAAALACAGYGLWAREPGAQAMSFFGTGVLLLAAGVAALSALLRRAPETPSRRLATLGVRNAGRHRGRSLLTAGLLAAASFLLLAVQAFHQDPGKTFREKNGGSGGYALFAETDVPVYQNWAGPAGREDLRDAVDRARLTPDLRNAIAGLSLHPFRLHAGEDASCLNLYQPTRPRLLGVPRSVIDGGGFEFQATEARGPRERSNPWLLLEQDRPGGAIPVFGEANTVQWVLHKQLGDELEEPNESGKPVRLRIVGLLKDSIFQSELLLSDANFRKLYPRQEGYQFFLIHLPSQDEERPAASGLETALAPYGLTVTPSIDRLEAYLAVENTYLATFQALGGLGLLLGALGLAVVMVRTVWERRGELALLRALGYRRTALGRLILAENGFLLVAGLVLGTVAALVAVAPHVREAGGRVPWAAAAGLMVAVLAVGLGAGALAVAGALRAPLLAALRRE